MASGNSSGSAAQPLLRPMTSADAFAFGEMVFASQRPRLFALQPEGPFFGVAAEIDGLPAGAALAETRDGETRVLSLFVAPQFRGRHLGETLLAEIETLSPAHGTTNGLVIGYLAGRPSTEPLEAALARLGWNAPVPDTLLCKCRNAFEGWPLFEGMQGANEEFQLFPWRQLSEEDKRWIETTQNESHWIPPDLYPLQFENLEPINSLGIRHKGRPVGWVLTHRIAPDTIRYTCSFMHPDLQRGVHIFPAYREASRLQKLAGVPNLLWMVPFRHRGMAAWVLRRFPKHLLTVTESRRCSRPLTHTASTTPEVPLAAA